MEANHMLLENIEKARVSLDKALEPGPLDAEFEKEPDFEPDEGTLLARLKRWGNKFRIPLNQCRRNLWRRRNHSLPRQSSLLGLPMCADSVPV